MQTIKHPNIVRLYDVIETDKYIGIILEYASGGELFDHILAHRYLKERDACKLFAQLVSGVWYIHQKKIVHRDLKLENLLLDRHRNVIITDFGFANRFEHRADDLMQTSCGSPCYAAPELVISEGLYVGSAVDIWSCGVILYAMLAGYLPFDDDPANPDGDNINLLYRYIVNTPLTFPEYVSADARDLLSIMLVPDPVHRADLNQVMAHHWLKPYAHLFDRSVQDLERLAMEQHQQKRLAYQRQMKQQAAAAAAAEQQKMQRSVSARVDASAPATTNGHRSRHAPPSAMNQDYLYEANPDESLFSSPAPVPVSRRHPASVVVGPTHSTNDDDPFGPPPVAPPNVDVRMQEEPQRARKSSATGSRSSRKQQPPPSAMENAKTSPERRKADRQRHTIQLEYGGEEDARPIQSTPKAKHRAKPQQALDPEVATIEDEGVGMEDDARRVTVSDAIATDESLASEVQMDGNGSISKALKPLPNPPANGEITPKTSSSMRIDGSSQEIPESTPSDIHSVKSPSIAVIPTSPSRNEMAYDGQPITNGSSRTGSVNSGASGSSKGRSHRRGMSVDKIVGKLWGGASDTEGVSTNGIKARRPSTSNVTSTGTLRTPSFASSKRPSTLEVQPVIPASVSPDSKTSAQSAADAAVKAEAKKSRRNTFNVIVEPLSKRISQRSKSRGDATPASTESRPVEKPAKPVALPITIPAPEGKENVVPTAQSFSTSETIGSIPASTNKASKVMQWFRYRSKSREPSVGSDYEPTESERATTPTNDEKEAPISDPQTPRATSFQPRGPLPSQTAVRAPVMNRSASSHVSNISIPQTPHSAFIPRTMNRLSNMVGTPQAMRATYNKTAIRLHHGAVDQGTVTTGSPPDVMAHVTKVLLDMGMEVQQESEYKYRCIRSKRKKITPSATAPGGLTALNMMGSAASSGVNIYLSHQENITNVKFQVDKRGLPMPSQSSFTSTGGMLKGLLMRRQSSQVSTHQSLESESPTESRDPSKSSRASREKLSVLPSAPQHEPIYGDRSIDQGDEVRFSVELTRIDGLEDTFSIDIRRLKGHLRSYKFLYDAVRE